MMMQTPLEIYSVVLGFKYAQIISEVLIYSYIALLPFLGLAVEAFHRVSTISFGNIWDASFRYTAFRFLAMCFTASMAFYPFVNLKVTEITYQLSCSGKSGAALSTYGNTGTSYDKTFQSYDITNVKIPVLVDMAMSLASGAAYATEKSTPCSNDVGDLISAVVVSRLSPNLVSDIGAFRQTCYQPAITKFTEARPDKSIYSDTMASYGGTNDLGWLGSHVLDQLYYANIIANNPIAPFPYTRFRSQLVDQNVANAYSSYPKYGYPNCSQWWNNSNYGLKNRIIKEIEAYQPHNDHLSNGVSLVSKFKSWIDGAKSYIPFYNSTVQSNLAQDIIIKEALYNRDSMANSHMIVGGQYGNGFMQDLDRTGQMIAGWGQWASSMGNNLTGQIAEEQQISTIMPVIISVSVFLVLLVFPFFMIGSGYSFQTFLTFAGILFGLIMTPAIMGMISSYAMSIDNSTSYFSWSYPNLKSYFNNYIVYLYYVTPFALSGSIAGLGYIVAGGAGAGISKIVQGASNTADSVVKDTDNGAGAISGVYNQAGAFAEQAATATGDAVSGGSVSAVSNAKDLL